MEYDAEALGQLSVRLWPRLHIFNIIFVGLRRHTWFWVPVGGLFGLTLHSENDLRGVSFPFRGMKKGFACSPHCDLTHAWRHFLPCFRCQICRSSVFDVRRLPLFFPVSPFSCPPDPFSFSPSPLPFPLPFPLCSSLPTLGIEPGTLYLLGKCWTTGLHSSPLTFSSFFASHLWLTGEFLSGSRAELGGDSEVRKFLALNYTLFFLLWPWPGAVWAHRLFF